MWALFGFWGMRQSVQELIASETALLNIEVGLESKKRVNR